MTHEGNARRATDEEHFVEVAWPQVGIFQRVIHRSERRKDERGGTSKNFGRKVMGNKGVGKLAPFGICQQIELLTAGGDLTKGKDKTGKSATGYLRAHLILERDDILKDEEFDYEPKVGALDGTICKSSGTKISLRIFVYRRVPTMGDFPFAHLASLPARPGNESRDKRERHGTSAGPVERT